MLWLRIEVLQYQYLQHALPAWATYFTPYLLRNLLSRHFHAQDILSRPNVEVSAAALPCAASSGRGGSKGRQAKHQGLSMPLQLCLGWHFLNISEEPQLQQELQARFKLDDRIVRQAPAWLQLAQLLLFCYLLFHC